MRKVIGDHGFKVKKNFSRSGELGCFISHYRVWEKMVNENIDHAFISEEDIILSRHSSKIAEFYKRSIELPSGKFVAPYQAQFKDDGNKFKLRKMTNLFLGTFSYICDKEFAITMKNLVDSMGICDTVDQTIHFCHLTGKITKYESNIPFLLHNNERLSSIWDQRRDKNGVRIEK